MKKKHYSHSTTLAGVGSVFTAVRIFEISYQIKYFFIVTRVRQNSAPFKISNGPVFYSI